MDLVRGYGTRLSPPSRSGAKCHETREFPSASREAGCGRNETRMHRLNPKDHAEAVATFRHAVIGPLCARALTRGELATAIRELTEERFRAPGATRSKSLSTGGSPWMLCVTPQSRTTGGSSSAGALNDIGDPPAALVIEYPGFIESCTPEVKKLSRSCSSVMRV